VEGSKPKGNELKAKIEITDGTLIPERGEGSIFSAWKISFLGALLLIVLLPLLMPDPYWEILKFVPDGILVTFQVTLLAISLALVIGLLTGLGQISRITVINRLATVYVEIIRGIPLLVQLFYIYFALGKVLKLEGIPAAVIAMAVCYGAYMVEIFRAGIQAIPRGQMEAALALGMSRTQALWRVILPQPIKIILPPIGNECIALLKEASLVSILAISDLLRRGREYAATTFHYFESYTMVALVYLVLTLFLSRMVGIMEERLHRSGR
jgi:polar amino acid transport system permease protein